MSEPAGCLAGKVAVITGAGRGLGRAYALHLARLGADVAVNDLSMDTWREFDEALAAPTVPDEVRALGRRSIGVIADVTDRGQVARMVTEVLDQLGRIDILINNAGGSLRPGPALASEVPIEDFAYTMDINLWGTVICCQAVAPVMKRQGYGKIVNVGSLSGLWTRGDGAGTAYAVAKAAIHHYTRKLAADLGPHGIRVNAIAPGWIITSRAVGRGGRGPGTELDKQLSQRIALRHQGQPEDCAKVVEFLVSDLSDYVTGQVIAVDGGVALFPT